MGDTFDRAGHIIVTELATSSHVRSVPVQAIVDFLSARSSEL